MRSAVGRRRASVPVFADIVIGMPYAPVGSNGSAGRVDVWFGRPRSTVNPNAPVPVQGTPGDDTLTWTAGPDALIGGQGDVY